MLRKLLLVTVTMIASAQADTVSYHGGMAFINPTNDPMDQISCEVLGASYRTQRMPGYEMMIGTMPGVVPVKPTPGWCLKAVVSSLDVGHIVPITNPDWPINLGKLHRIIGVRCEINSDRMGFTCDWPPFGSKKTATRTPPDIAETIEAWQKVNSACRDSPNAQDACDRREAITETLESRNWCYGRPGEFGYQMNWHKCD